MTGPQLLFFSCSNSLISSDQSRLFSFTMSRIIFLFCCVAYSVSGQPKLTTVLSNIPTSIRGLSVVDNNVAWFSGSKGHVGRSLDGGRSWAFAQLKNYETLDFRSLYAFDSLRAIIANVGSPAHILLTTDGGRTWREVYNSNHPDIFLDGIDFWDSKSGVIYGDPINEKMTLLKTNDEGVTWQAIAESKRPKLEKGEASFAASGTGIRCYAKNKVMVATGGMVSRLWLSKDRGENWVSIPTPINQGKASAGIFSVGMNEKQMVIVGGDYLADSLSAKNVFITSNGGKSWAAPFSPTRGYRSSVESISNDTWVATGQRGLDVSYDNGRNWTALSDEKGLHVARRARKGACVLAAGNGKVVWIDFQKK
jgi:photosystem II stability/assembly factor-like uncharacterized protein